MRIHRVAVLRTAAALVAIAPLAAPIVAPLVAPLVATAVPGPASVAEPAASRTPSTSADRSLAGHRWHYRAQVDGRGGKDRITITTLRGFTLDDYGFGYGRIKVSVRFAGGRGFAQVWEDISYLSVRTPWTPWLGATDLDRRGGKELVIGFSTGAHAQLLTAYAYRHGQLVELQAPGGGSWVVNSSFGTGTSGWRCTRRGVQGRSVSPPEGGHARVARSSYVLRGSGWVRTAHTTRRVALDAQGSPPRSTARFATFACTGLPRRVL